ncbi:MAG TPA: hypothetical protein VFZ83_02845 [Acidimicrobiia bacterium]|nr:hypothetical protein [Acidimicrobiia bacterium]
MDPMEPLPEEFVETRRSLHAVAEHVLAAARYAAVGRIGLEPVGRGFGAPPFPEPRREADRQLFVESDLIVRVDGGATLVEPLTTLRRAAEFAQVDAGAPPVYEASTALDLDRELAIDASSSVALGSWFRLVAGALDDLVASVDAERETPGSCTLWPEHFDLAVDLGAPGARANYGGSPGDDAHPLPYLYVGPWDDPGADEFWNATSFRGALLSYDELRFADDPAAAARAFFASGHARLSEQID